MICLAYHHHHHAESRMSTFTIIFYTCIWIPFRQLQMAFLGFLFMLYTAPCHDDHPADGTLDREINSLVNSSAAAATRFDHLVAKNKYGKDGDGSCRAVDESCSVCLVDFEREEVVSRLNICGHVFHLHCIQRWIYRNQFTCPLCRSLILNHARQ